MSPAVATHRLTSLLEGSEILNTVISPFLTSPWSLFTNRISPFVRVFSMEDEATVTISITNSLKQTSSVTKLSAFKSGIGDFLLKRVTQLVVKGLEERLNHQRPMLLSGTFPNGNYFMNPQ